MSLKRAIRCSRSTACRPISGQTAILPEVPSAGEVKDKGLDIGSSEAVLLKKVEELTLYLIRQNDSLKAQQQEIAELKRKVAKLSSRR